MAATDTYKGHPGVSPGGPRNLALVTPNNSVDLTMVSQWVYIGTAGVLVCTPAEHADDDPVTTPTMIAGWHLMQLKRIWATGTTATDIMVGW